MIDPNQLSEEDLNRLLLLLKGQPLQPPQPAPESINPNMLAFLLKSKQPQVTPGTETSTTGVRG